VSITVVFNIAVVPSKGSNNVRIIERRREEMKEWDETERQRSYIEKRKGKLKVKH
jgi:hypothetical protein